MVAIRRGGEAVRSRMNSPKDDTRILLDGMTRLYEVGELCVRAGENFDRCLEAILQAAMDITAADKGNIQILDPGTGTLSIKAQRGFGGPFLAFFARVDPGHASASGAASRELRRVLVEDVKESGIFADQLSLDIMLDAGVR